MSFAEQLQTGLLGEDEISKWLILRGNTVLPAYQVSVNHGKGPRLFGEFGQLISPDLLVFNSQKVMWIEAKTKSAFTWHRITGTWQTGLDAKHWGHYKEVADRTPFTLWIMFLHRKENAAKDTPEGMTSPSGLFGNDITKLRASIDHTSDKHGPSGMVYWRRDSLRKLADIDEIESSTFTK